VVRKLNAVVPVPLNQLVPLEQLTRRIVILRGQRVMLSTELAGLYEVEPKVLMQAVRRNIDRFPLDFAFQLSAREFADLRSQTVTAKSAAAKPFAKVRFAPYAFTQEGIAMLSTVLRSHHAIQVSIAIMRAFVQLRQMLLSHKELSQKLAALVAVSAGGFHSLALIADGTVMSWGNNELGQLGDGTTQTRRNAPAPVSGLANAIAIAAGSAQSFALLSDGTVMA
jgi:hypothetical protein